MAKTKKKEEKKEEVLPNKAKKPAIFHSKFRNQILTMRPATIDRRPGANAGDKGKRINFSPNGQYQTADTEEIKFLMNKCERSTEFCKITCVQEPEF